METKQPGVFSGNYLHETTPASELSAPAEGNTNVLKTCSSFSDPQLHSNGPPPLGLKPNQSHQRSSGIHSTSPISNGQGHYLPLVVLVVIMTLTKCRYNPSHHQMHHLHPQR